MELMSGRQTTTMTSSPNQLNRFFCLRLFQTLWKYMILHKNTLTSCIMVRSLEKTRLCHESKNPINPNYTPYNYSIPAQILTKDPIEWDPFKNWYFQEIRFFRKMAISKKLFRGNRTFQENNQILGHSQSSDPSCWALITGRLQKFVEFVPWKNFPKLKLPGGSLILDVWSILMGLLIVQLNISSTSDSSFSISDEFTPFKTSSTIDSDDRVWPVAYIWKYWIIKMKIK